MCIELGACAFVCGWVSLQKSQSSRTCACAHSMHVLLHSLDFSLSLLQSVYSAYFFFSLLTSSSTVYFSENFFPCLFFPKNKREKVGGAGLRSVPHSLSHSLTHAACLPFCHCHLGRTELGHSLPLNVVETAFITRTFLFLLCT